MLVYRVDAAEVLGVPTQQLVLPLLQADGDRPSANNALDVLRQTNASNE